MAQTTLDKLLMEIAAKGIVSVSFSDFERKWEFIITGSNQDNPQSSKTKLADKVKDQHWNVSSRKLMGARSMRNNEDFDTYQEAIEYCEILLKGGPQAVELERYQEAWAKAVAAHPELSDLMPQPEPDIYTKTLQSR